MNEPTDVKYGVRASGAWSAIGVLISLIGFIIGVYLVVVIGMGILFVGMAGYIKGKKKPGMDRWVWYKRKDEKA